MIKIRVPLHRPIASLLFALVVFWSSTISAAERFTLDPTHTTLAFLIDHVGFAKTLGWFTEVSGDFMFDDATGTASEITITVNTASVYSANEARDKHVRNKDFLNVKKFPDMVFTAGSTTIDENGKGEMVGELQLLGQRHPLTLSVTLNKADRYPFGHKRLTLGVSARGSVQRSQYGMNYGVANELVGDLVDLIIETEAIQD
jgi:polyisoprenoid-binding protein YceI